MKYLLHIIAILLCCVPLHGQIDPYRKNILTTNFLTLGTNLYFTNGVLEASASPVTLPLTVVNGGTGNDLSGGLAGAIPYFDFGGGKFVTTGSAYTNGLVFESTLGFLSVFRTNITGDIMLNLQEGGASAPSIQGYSDKFVVANTNLSFDAVGPYSIRLRVNGSNQLEIVSGGISLSGTSNILGDDGTFLTYNGSRLALPTNLWATVGGVLSPNPTVNLVRIDNQFSTLGGRIINRVSTATNYTLTASNHYVVATATLTNSLPAASSVSAGQICIVKSASGITTVRPVGADTIDGIASDDVLVGKSSHIYVSDGISNWEVSGGYSDIGIRSTFDEFESAVITGAFGSMGWSTSTASGSVTQIEGETNAIGLLRFSTLASATGRASLVSGSGSLNARKFGVARMIFSARVRINSLSDSTNTFTWRGGFKTGLGTNPTDGAYLVYDQATSTNWFGVTANNSNRTTATDGAGNVVVTAGNWYTLGIDVNAAATEAVFRVNGTIIGVSQSNFSTNAFTPSLEIKKTVGTNAVTADLDWVRIVTIQP